MITDRSGPHLVVFAATLAMLAGVLLWACHNEPDVVPVDRGRVVEPLRLFEMPVD